VGAIAGFSADRWLRRRRGGAMVYVSNWKISYRGRGESATPVDVPAGDAEFVQLFFTADIFNSSDEPTGFREVCIEFDAGGKLRLSVTPGDADSLRVEAMREDIRNVEVINLAPKQWSHWHFRRNVWGDDVAKVVAAEQVYLAMTDPADIRHRYLVSDLPRRGLAFAGR
jgi:hypothetical protein